MNEKISPYGQAGGCDNEVGGDHVSIQEGEDEFKDTCRVMEAQPVSMMDER